MEEERFEYIKKRVIEELKSIILKGGSGGGK